MEQAAKEAFFDALYELDEDSQGEETCNASVILRQSRPSKSGSRDRSSSRPHSTIGSISSGPLLTRTTSAPMSHSLRNKTSDISSKSQSQEASRTPNMAKPFDSTDFPRASLKQSGKRKRGESIQIMPEAQQIFNGLSFCKAFPCRSYMLDLTDVMHRLFSEQRRCTCPQDTCEKGSGMGRFVGQRVESWGYSRCCRSRLVIPRLAQIPEASCLASESLRPNIRVRGC